MYDNQLFLEAKNLIENNAAFTQLFSGLPANSEIRVVLESRIPCTLKLLDGNATLLAMDTKNADLELTLFSESIRRLKGLEGGGVLNLLKEIGALAIRDQAKIRIQTSASNLYQKGYLHSLKGVAPEIKKDLSFFAMSLLGKVNSAAETIKSLLKK